jgi:hypothetical protein
MTIAAALEIALAVLVLGMAAWTIAARETFAAVVGFVAYGLLSRSCGCVWRPSTWR